MASHHHVTKRVRILMEPDHLAKVNVSKCDKLEMCLLTELHASYFLPTPRDLHHMYLPSQLRLLSGCADDRHPSDPNGQNLNAMDVP